MAGVNDFRARALALAERIESDRDGPADAELEELRALWRSLDGAARAGADAAARTLADAQARRASAADDRDAQLALKGLDRIAVEAPPHRTYGGPRDPAALLAHFGFGEFRPGQRESVQAALEGRDSLVVIPTGGGKSLCYQLPGIAAAELTVIVSPLIALLADQYRRLVLGGHPAAMMASGMAESAVMESLHAIRAGRARIVLCSPERFVSTSFMSALSARDVDLFVVDEA